MRTTRIVIFAKAPVPGMAKTRLAPALGEAGAADLARRMLETTVREAIAADLSTPILCLSPAPTHPDWTPFLPAGSIQLADQGSGDLGQRLARAAERVTSAGENVLLVGTDCPALDREMLREAGGALQSHDAVIHPTHDGGYALLGLRHSHPTLFTGIAWSGPTVAAETIRRVEGLGWSLGIGATLHDIDEPDDLRHLPR